MTVDRYKDILREALREEAEIISRRSDEQSRIDLVALLEGAQCCFADRLGYGRVEIDHPFFKRGWEIASKIQF